MEAGGMVAVVHGLKDAGLAVTVLDGEKQFTLMPRHIAEQYSAPIQHLCGKPQQMTNSIGTSEPVRHDSSAQATDDRYATMYQTTHCRMTPTSPPEQLTEFPPQRAELCRGHGNFEVGGLGSGESYTPRASASFKGGMSWSDRGCVCSPRASREPDAFANSLRSYPNVSMERSSEIVERLINYTHAKSKTKNSYSSPPRQQSQTMNEDHNFNHNLSQNTSRNVKGDLIKSRRQESPTRDCCGYEDGKNRNRRQINSDRDGRRVTDSQYNWFYPYTRSGNSARKEQYEHWDDNGTSYIVLTALQSANMEVQAAANMVSKHVATEPGIQPTRKNVAVSISPTISRSQSQAEGDFSVQNTVDSFKPNIVTRSVETESMAIDLSLMNSMKRTYCYCLQRSKSDETFNKSKKNFEDEIVELLSKVLDCPILSMKVCDLRLEVLKHIENKLIPLSANYPNYVKNKKTEEPSWIDSVELAYRTGNSLVFPNIESNLDTIIKDWIKYIPIKICDAFGSTVKRRVIQNYVNKINTIISKGLLSKDNCSMRSELFSFLTEIPVKYPTCQNVNYLKNAVDMLERKVLVLRDHRAQVIGQLSESVYNITDNSLKTYVQPTEEELRNIISKELNDILQRVQFKAMTRIQLMETEIIDVLIDSIQAIRQGDDKGIFKEVNTLLQELGEFNENQSRMFTETLITQLKETLRPVYNIPYKYFAIDKYGRKSTTFQNINESVSYQNINSSNIKKYFDDMNNQLFNAIDGWLRNININNLVEDIVNRLKYLSSKPSMLCINEDELAKYYEYTIKLINKLTTNNKSKRMEQALDLIEKIQNIQYSLMSSFVQRGTSNQQICMLDNLLHKRSFNRLPLSTTDKINSRDNSMVVLTSLIDNHVSQNQTLSSEFNSFVPTLEQLNENYDAYVKEWVNKIPITEHTAEEKAIAEKARIGIYNGIWKAITKFKFDPAIFHNTFAYEDALDDELEELLGLLPQTADLEQNKHLLKVELIERTTNTNALIKATAAPASFKQQLIDNVSMNLPDRSIIKTNDQYYLLFEEQQILKLVDDFILCTRYKDIDRPKTLIYRNKLISEVKNLINNIKKTYRKEIKDIDTDLYVNSVLNALHKVPLPEDKILTEEANKIEMDQEIDKWMSDLTITQSNPEYEKWQRRKIRNALLKKVDKLKKEVNISDLSGERLLKHEISSLLENNLLPQDGSTNIKFMTEELINRIKNKIKQQKEVEGKRKSVVISDTVDYYEFSQHMPGCSSFHDLPVHYSYEPSYNVKDGFIVESPIKEESYNPYLSLTSQTHNRQPDQIPSEDFFSMEESRIPRYQEIQEHEKYQRFQEFQNPDSSKNLPECCQIMGQSSQIPGIQCQISPNYAIPPGSINTHLKQNCADDQPSTSHHPVGYQDVHGLTCQPGQFINNLGYVPNNTKSDIVAHESKPQSIVTTNLTTPHSQVPFIVINEPSFANVSRQSQGTHRYNESVAPKQIQQASIPENLVVNPQSSNNGINKTTPNGFQNSLRNGPGTQPQQNVIGNQILFKDECTNIGKNICPSHLQNTSTLSNQIPGIKLLEPGCMQQSINPTQQSFYPEQMSSKLPSQSSFGQPQGFSTPQPNTQIPPDPPQLHKKKRKRRRRRLAQRLFDSDDTDNESEGDDEECTCENGTRRRPPFCYAYEDLYTGDIYCCASPFDYLFYQ